MYRQVSVEPKQRDLQMILWRDNPSDPIQTYHLNTVTYGEASAAFLSCRCLKQLANECNDPDVARTINNDFYVDDLCTGDDSASKLLKICHDTANVLQSGCFPLRKWIFNFDNDLSSSEMAKELSLGEDSQCKTLGLGWYNLSDELYFHTKFSGGTEDITKRKILSGASQIFDPIGLINPVITTAKTLLQSLYLLKLGWDEIVPLNIAQSWISFVNSLSSLNEIRIPRYVMGCNNTRKELHIFTDASQVAYGSCAYIRTIDNRSAVTVRLLYSKGKVASLQPVSIPRLELSGALVGARLYHKIINSLRSKFDNVVFWTDSTIVLGWLRMPCNLLKTFVQNRVAEIHELTKDSLCQWRHVSGKDNPADIVSRGQSLGMLKENSLWWNGPTYLHDPQFDVTSLKAPLVPNHTELPEIKPTAVQSHVTQQNNDESWLDFNRFSQFVRMQRAGAYALRFIYNARNKIKRIGPLSVDELNESLTTLTKLAQRESFSDLFNKNGLSVSKSNSLSKLNLFLDDKQIIRVGGRIQNSLDFSFNKKHPALLSSKHYFTLLLFRHQHKQLMHAAPQLLLYTVREAWWPVAGRSLARRVVHACVTCARLRAQTLQPIMGNLPAQRLQPGFPFERCGVDYAGPVLILNRRAPATADLRDKPMLRLTRYQRVEQIRQHFWARWSKEYVSELQQRIKWRTSSEDLKEHTMVLIKDDNLPPLKWSLGRITRVYPGRDGISRVADIRTANGTTRRAFSKICPLPVDDCSC
ncbi:uncharacterized protein LOC125490306 [Plutella xylostella]|uniref:uncharacterized protein LOC125490306 n=1 Tax=Plutella xylostella TaxID=51655 RepID=UPI0020330327|nr:uncharacterized protein LOC125490306 [Plutella xylostella]